MIGHPTAWLLQQRLGNRPNLAVHDQWPTVGTRGSHVQVLAEVVLVIVDRLTEPVVVVRVDLREVLGGLEVVRPEVSPPVQSCRRGTRR